MDIKDKSDKDIEDFVREKYKDIPEGIYDIGSGDLVCKTGKEGYIDFKIRETKWLRKHLNR